MAHSSTAPAGPEAAPGYRRIAAMAGPIILANCAAPLLGLTDTAVIGHVGSATDLAAIALGSLLFNFLFWSFGFLRMGTTAFVAQADGRGDGGEATLTLLRGVLIAAGLGALLIALQKPLIALALALFSASEAAEAVTAEYFLVRIWSAPATLALYVVMGYLIGRGAGRTLLLLQLLLNAANAGLDLLFAGLLGWGATGIALGTALAEWGTLAIALWLVLRMADRGPLRLPRRQLRQSLLDRGALRRFVTINAAIMVRTLALLLGFALFTDQGARFGDTILAGNHILLQLISFSAFFLDGFAFTSEALAGNAYGRGDARAFRQVLWRASLLAAGTALLLSTLLLVAGPLLIATLTQQPAVEVAAIAALPFCATYVLLSFAAFQLDGVFLGTAQAKPLRNAALLATTLFALLAWLLTPTLENDGLWLAFIGYVVLRALALGAWLPRLLRQLRVMEATGGTGDCQRTPQAKIG